MGLGHRHRHQPVFYSLYGTQYPHATDVRVFTVHVVREDDHLENVRVYRFAEIKMVCYVILLFFFL
jgi:hypothetical protein